MPFNVTFQINEMGLRCITLCVKMICQPYYIIFLKLFLTLLFLRMELELLNFLILGVYPLFSCILICMFIIAWGKWS